jgi:hypothetical protein
MSVISELGRLRQEDCEFEASLDYKERCETIIVIHAIL